jgi:hypothetical protein
MITAEDLFSMGLFTLKNMFRLPRAWKWSLVHFPGVLLLAEDPSKRGDVYNILWILVFGFATLNILALVTKKFEPNRSRLSFGESIALMVVVVSVILLGWEMLYFFKVLPIKLKP